MKSEWIKLTTTKAFWWTTALVFTIGVGLSALLTFVARLTAKEMNIDGGFANAESTTIGVSSLGLAVIIIQAAMVFTTEYRNGTATPTFVATPRRAQVILAKAVVYSIVSAIIIAVTIVCAYLVGAALAGSPLPGMPAFEPWNDKQALRLLWVYPLVTVGLVLLTMGVSVLVRQTAGAIAIMLVWFLALENIIALMGRWGAKASHFGPMTNFHAFVARTDLSDSITWQFSVFIFLAWAVGLLAVGIAVALRRDV